MAILAGTRPQATATATAGAAPRVFAPAVGAAPRPVLLSGSGILFAGLLALMLVEYGGLGKNLPVLQAIRFSTVVAYGLLLAIVARVGLKAFVEYPQSKALLSFVTFTGCTILWAVVRSYVPTSLRAHIDYFALYLSMLYLVDRPRRFQLLSLTCAVITIFLIARNFPKFFEEQRTATFTAGYFMGDGNDFAWGLVTLMPFPVYLMLGRRQPVLYRMIGALALVMGLLGVLGTKSRGAALAIGAAGLFYWIMLARRRAAAAIGLAVLIAIAAVMAPHGYMDRLKTIDNYEEDTSAQGRLRAWKAAGQMALDFPLGVGAGSFNSAFGRFYMPNNVQGYAPNRWISAHSVYFKVLGEYGILGVLIVIWIIVSSVRVNLASLRTLRANEGVYDIPDMWPALLSMGVVGYAVGAGFLGGIAYPHLYFLCGLTVGCQRAIAAGDPGAVPETGVAPASSRPAVAPPMRPVRAPQAALVPRPGPDTPGKGRFFE